MQPLKSPLPTIPCSWKYVSFNSLEVVYCNETSNTCRVSHLLNMKNSTIAILVCTHLSFMRCDVMCATFHHLKVVNRNMPRFHHLGCFLSEVQVVLSRWTTWIFCWIKLDDLKKWTTVRRWWIISQIRAINGWKLTCHKKHVCKHHILHWILPTSWQHEHCKGE